MLHKNRHHFCTRNKQTNKTVSQQATLFKIQFVCRWIFSLNSLISLQSLADEDAGENK